MNNQELTRAIFDEISNPNLGITEQFFAVHKVKVDNPVALIEPGKQSFNEVEHPWWNVYLNLEDVSYFWLMQVQESDGKIVPILGNSSPYVKVYLRIASKILTGREIEERLNLPATEIKEIGELVHKNHPYITSNRTYKENRYYYYPSTPREWDFGDKLKVLIEDLSLRSQELKAISEESVFCQVTVAYYGWQCQMWGCHFDAKDLAALASMGVSVDIDIYAEGPDLPDED